MRIRGVLFLALPLSLNGVASLSQAATIDLSTGLDAGNSVITVGGTSDAHWTVDQQFGGIGPALVATPTDGDYWSGWVPNDSQSAWVARGVEFATYGSGTYNFYRQFTLYGTDFSGVSISGSWAGDDSGSLLLNGNAVDSQADPAWNALHSFSVPLGSPFFQAGVNTLVISLNTDNLYDGARLDGALSGPDSALVPEPASLSLLGLAGVVTLRRHRRTLTCGWPCISTSISVPQAGSGAAV